MAEPKLLAGYTQNHLAGYMTTRHCTPCIGHVSVTYEDGGALVLPRLHFDSKFKETHAEGVNNFALKISNAYGEQRLRETKGLVETPKIHLDSGRSICALVIEAKGLHKEEAVIRSLELIKTCAVGLYRPEFKGFAETQDYIRSLLKR